MTPVVIKELKRWRKALKEGKISRKEYDKFMYLLRSNLGVKG